ncbi:MAG: radical SAM family heme chaperone HemW [Pseudomonadota bacterium]
MHLPWCVKKCPYCDFNSHTAGDSAPTSRYVKAVLADIESEVYRADGRRIETVFIGGGTPSLFSPDEIATLLEAVRSHFTLAADAEITMEANPGTVEYGAPAGYRDAGVNRLSIGAQSFDDELLTKLGRIHASKDIQNAFAAARAGGFDNINLDLMHGLPQQSVAMALDDLQQAIDLGPEHISWYQLTLEPNTVFHARPPDGLPDDHLAWDIQQAGKALLSENGYDQYEVSAYAREGRHCRHNLNYWLFGDYLAVGAGAHGKATRRGEAVRYQKPANPAQYMQDIEAGSAACQGDVIARDDLAFEFMMNALRLSDGFNENEFAQRTGLASELLPQLAKIPLEKGLIERDALGIWCPTLLGQRFLNDLVGEFLYTQDAR